MTFPYSQDEWRRLYSSSVISSVIEPFEMNSLITNCERVLEKIFSRVLANPPVHLIKQISALRRPFDELNYRLLSGLVTHKKRLASMPLSDILALMELYQSYCNRSQQMREAVKQGMQACEELRQNYLDAFLHGVLND